jgi:hypothetical protein
MFDNRTKILIADQQCSEAVNCEEDLIDWIKSFLCDSDVTECHITKPEGFDSSVFFS